MVASAIYAAGLARVGARRWLPWVMAGFAGLMVVERVLISTATPAIYPVVWLGGQVVILVSLTIMWNAAGEACTTRQGRRLFPLFASAGIAGGIVGNGLTGPLASLLGTENLLLVQAALLVAGGVTARMVGGRFFRDQPRELGTSTASDLLDGLHLTRRRPLLRHMTWAAGLLSLVFFIVVFPFAEVVTQSFPSEVEMAGFLGLFSALATGGTFLVSLLAANRLFAKLGVVTTLLVVPVVYVVGFSIWLVSFGIATAVLVRGAQWIAVNAISATAWSALFNVVPGRRRGQVMAFMAAVPTQLGTTASGALLIAGSELSISQMTALGLALAVGLMLLVLRMRPAYTEALVHAVREGVVEVFTLTQPGMQKPALDADAQRALTAVLNAPEPKARAMAVTLLGRLGGGAPSDLVMGALADPDWRVRLAALQASIDLEHPQAAVVAGDMLDDPAPEVRRLAVGLTSRAGADQGQRMATAMQDPDPEVRAIAAAAAGGSEGANTLERMLASDRPQDVTAALRALGGRPDLAQRDLISFAAHPDRRVRAAAARALSPRPDAGSTVRSLLDDHSIMVRREAAAALASSGNGTAQLMDVLVDGSVRATEAALETLAEGSHTGESLTAWASQEVARAAVLRRYRLALATADPSRTRAYLVDLLASRQERLERWALRATTTPDTEGTMTVVARGLRSGDQETRAQAVEALESIGIRAVTRCLIPLLEDDETSARLDPRASLRELSQDLDIWIRALAVRCLTEQLPDDLGQLRGVADADESGLVRSAVSRLEALSVRETDTLDIVDRVLALQRVSMFSEVDPEDLERIAALTSERHYDPGELIFAWGAEGTEMLVIVKGEVTVSRQGEGSFRPIALRSGEHVGELALLRGRPRSADVIAGPDGVHGLILKGAELHAILDERPEVALAMLATLAERLGTEGIA